MPQNLLNGFHAPSSTLMFSGWQEQGSSKENSPQLAGLHILNASADALKGADYPASMPLCSASRLADRAGVA
jgi:hypothetical protein